jgi:hypothetical protein
MGVAGSAHAVAGVILGEAVECLGEAVVAGAVAGAAAAVAARWLRVGREPVEPVEGVRRVGAGDAVVGGYLTAATRAVAAGRLRVRSEPLRREAVECVGARHDARP